MFCDMHRNSAKCHIFGGCAPRRGLWAPNSNSAEIFVQRTYPRSYVILCLVIWKLSCWQMHPETHKQTSTQHVLGSRRTTLSECTEMNHTYNSSGGAPWCTDRGQRWSTVADTRHEYQVMFVHRFWDDITDAPAISTEHTADDAEHTGDGQKTSPDDRKTKRHTNRLTHTHTCTQIIIIL